MYQPVLLEPHLYLRHSEAFGPEALVRRGLTLRYIVQKQASAIRERLVRQMRTLLLYLWRKKRCIMETQVTMGLGMHSDTS